MEKDALLEIILRDLKEVETLTLSCKGKSEISKIYFRLARNKLNSILDEIDALEEVANTPSTIKEVPTTKPNVKPATSINEDEQKTVAKQNPNNNKESQPINPSSDEIAVIENSTVSAETNDSSGHTESKQPTLSSPNPAEKKPVEKKRDAPQPNISNGDDTTADNNLTEPPVKKPVVNIQNKHNPNVIPGNSSSKNNKILGEKLGSNRASFNEQIAKNTIEGKQKRSLTLPPITSLKKALGINDRFFYQRELFGGNADLMNQTLDQLDQMSGLEDARNFLMANFNWNPEDEATVGFLELVERRFS